MTNQRLYSTSHRGQVLECKINALDTKINVIKPRVIYIIAICVSTHARLNCSMQLPYCGHATFGARKRTYN